MYKHALGQHFSPTMICLLQVLDVAPTSPRQLREDMRICAYWSQQFSCLYPGKVSRPGTPTPGGCGSGSRSESDFICVEFDDEDSGVIPLEHIRMLPQEFPLQGKLL